MVATQVAGLPTATPIVLPSPTPTATPTPTPLPTPTPIPTSTPLPTPTPNPREIIARTSQSVVRITTATGAGTGFLVDPAGIILTAGHVVKDATVVTIEFSDGRKLEGTVKGRHLGGDVAVISVGASNLPVLKLGDSAALRPGDNVIKIGYALGLKGDPTVSTGIVSALRTEARTKVDYIQFDAQTNPGDSGGPVLNMQGNVVGIVVSKYVGAGVEGMAYATAANVVAPHIAKLVNGENECPPVPAVRQGQSYRNSTYGYTVALPQGSEWHFYDYSDGTTLFYKYQGTIPATKDYHVSAGVFIWVDNKGSYRTVDQYVDDWKQAYAVPGASVTVLSRQLVCPPIPGVLIGLEIEATTQVQRTPYRERWLFFSIGGQRYILQGLAWPELWEEQEGFIDTILYSIRF
ncbi:MAG: trypsin-like serine protease [Dehalococcoidia bacterium]|nr:trypsin-like serine protease [Dehalococcoidia bacterium]